MGRRTWANNRRIKDLFKGDGSGKVSRAKLVSALNWRPAKHEGKLHIRLVFHTVTVKMGKEHNNNSSSSSSGHIWKEILSPALCPFSSHHQATADWPMFFFPQPNSIMCSQLNKQISLICAVEEFSVICSRLTACFLPRPLLLLLLRKIGHMVSRGSNT